ncbi:hypothetical protein PSTG_19412, partial [Puccinia striiformis f. sp. tritici PST-78]
LTLVEFLYCEFTPIIIFSRPPYGPRKLLRNQLKLFLHPAQDEHTVDAGSDVRLDCPGVFGVKIQAIVPEFMVQGPL